MTALVPRLNRRRARIAQAMSRTAQGRAQLLTMLETHEGMLENLDRLIDFGAATVESQAEDRADLAHNLAILRKALGQVDA